MNCPSCGATATRERAKKTELGYATFFCPICQRTYNERIGTPFNYLEAPTDIVCWSLGSSVQKSEIFGGMIPLSDHTSL